MSKTPEELIEKYAPTFEEIMAKYTKQWDGCPYILGSTKGITAVSLAYCDGYEVAFLAGYKAAQEHAHAALEEAEARMEEIKDQVAGVSKKVWISVKDRLPGECAGLLIVYHAYLKEIGTSYYDDDMWCSSPWPINSEGITHWMPLPEPPKEEE